MSTGSPTSTIKFDDRSQVITFDYRRLLAIELATGGTVLQLVQEFASYHSDSDDQKQQEAATLRFSLTKAAQFLSGCFDTPIDTLPAVVPLHRFRDVFFLLLPAFVEAVKQLNGMSGGAAENPQPAQVSPA